MTLELNKIYNCDCLVGMKDIPDNSVDAIVTDPPYGLSFMGKKWDYDVPSVEIWKECLRVLKPGGYLLSFAGTRTQHRMAVRIEDAGFEIRDMIAWVYGSGFPKSLNIGKAVDKLQGNERESEIVKGKIFTGSNNNIKGVSGEYEVTKGTSEYEGWGTSLKPALEPITVARKPISENTIAENCLKWGTGGINIDGCRVEFKTDADKKESVTKNQHGDFNSNNGIRVPTKGIYSGDNRPPENYNPQIGRFPANLIHDGSDDVLINFPDVDEDILNDKLVQQTLFGDIVKKEMINSSRFFYCAKASKDERNEGCEDLEETRHADRKVEDGVGGSNPRNRTNTLKKNFHPTVKPLALMEYLVKLVSREDAIVLDPFVGSGTTALACKRKNRKFIGMEMNSDYWEIANKRLSQDTILSFGDKGFV